MKKSQKEIQKIAKLYYKSSFSRDSLDYKKISKVLNSIKNRYKAFSLDILNLYLKLVKRNVNETTITVESATDLDKNTLGKIGMVFEAKHKKRFIVTQKISPEIIGGLKIVIGDTEYDYSIKGKIEQLKEAASA